MNNIYEELYHHGILNQKWGVKNGPPYPLRGGDYSESERKAILKERKKKYSIYNKKHFDGVIKKDSIISTLSYDKDRTKKGGMFYGAYTEADKHQYNALFNKKIPQTLYDENGNEIGTGSFFKYRINNTTLNDIKVASEDSGAEIFRKLYSSNRDFYNYVTDPERMQKQFVDSKYKFKGYREARDVLQKMRKNPKYIPQSDELQKVYRMFNYTIPSDGSGNKRDGHDVEVQRAKFFAQAKKEGYGAILDTNDAIYGAFHAQSPVIVFDMESIALKDANRVKMSDKAFSQAVFVGRKMLGL